ncbi:MAG TPA: 5-formyltetrahydrofolate cyclo-ligase [Sedimenticola thiotaurini]|uniref:5-formyltetrahydrofolate cyclo-ligase n=1 Tax=Sedimenticola thiotaurini TaxID=1543721 RepID=A0A831RJI5_9GAMM|nr:5-formyltetrahydrofolate cyclo-ligase [Sedimenticola thiotaurini]
MSDSVPELRRSLRRRRRAIPEPVRRDHALQAAANFRCSPLFLRYRRIGLYLANDGELDPGPLADAAFDSGKRLYLPVLRPLARPSLWFSEYLPDGRLLRNRYGIPEPDIRAHPPLPPWGLDLLLLPLVGFDDAGRRLGMGGGFYDRTLAYLRHRRHWRRPLLIGLAHECQRVDRLPDRPWDVPLNGILTESRLQMFRASG